MTTLHNLIEPEGLLGHFRENPPEGFAILELACGAPAFAAPFDLLTTTSATVRRRAKRFRPAWFLKPRTAFIGTTVSELAPLPEALPADALVREIMTTLARDYPFVIVKDLPSDTTLVSEEDLAASRNVANACRDAGFVLMEGQALAWVPIDFASIDELLGRRSPARRKNIRRKLKSRAAMQIDELPLGDARFLEDAFLATLYAMYLNVYQQSEVHFDLLTPAFFRAVLQDATIDGVVFLYSAVGALIGFNLCVCANGRLIDKYVGFVYPAAREHDLYAVSWFHNLEYARTRGLRCYVAGWTDRDVKKELGAHFTFTQHAVYVRNPILRFALRIFRRFFESDHD